jgi:hypothetical protein
MALKSNATEYGIKTNLARLLATENITLEHRPGVPTAWFDIKNRQLVLPVWEGISENLYDMLVVHETGHALDTPLDKWMKAVKDLAEKHYKDAKTRKLAEDSIRGFINVVEDARIDKRQKRRYPGAKRDYIVGLKELYDRDFFGINGKDVNTLTFIDRANLYFKGGMTMLPLKFTKEEQGYIDRMDKAETFDEVIDIVNDIYTYARTNGQMQQQNKTLKLVITDDDGSEGDDMDGLELDDFDEIEDRRTKSGDEDGEGKDDKEGKEGKDGEGKSKSGEGKDGNGDGKGKGKGAADQQSKTGKEGQGNAVSRTIDKVVNVLKGKTATKAGTGAGPGDVPEHFIPESKTEAAAQRSIEKLVMQVDANYIYLKTPTFITKNIVDDFSVVIPAIERSCRSFDRRKLETQYMEWRKAEQDTITFMVKEFEMRKAADQHARIKISKTGVLDTNKLHSYKYNDDIFRRMATLPDGKNHGFVIILDWSGSMQSDLLNTMKQLMSLAMFCKRVNIPFDVYLFRTRCNEDTRESANQSMPDNMALTFGHFKLRNVLSSRMPLSMLNRAQFMLWAMANHVQASCDPMGGTPLNASIMALHDVVNAFQKKHRVQIVSTIIMTDGVSDTGVGWHGQTVPPVKKGGNKYFLRDQTSGKTYSLPGDPQRMYAENTHFFLEILKERTKSNLIGFYLLQGNLQGAAGVVGAEKLKPKAVQDAWVKNGFVGVPAVGYDEYFIIDTAKMGQVANLGAEVNKGGTSNDALTKAFAAFQDKKSVNRQLVKKFMDRVSNIVK